jgi:hypothetical protein
MMNRNGAPYNSFKDDRLRLWALVSRDLRTVVVVAIVCLTGAAPAWRAIRAWLF